MRKSKRGAELFEVLQKAPVPRKQLEVPEWWSSPSEGSNGSDEPPPPAEVSTEAEASPRAEASSECFEDDRERAFELDGSRIRISLTSFSASFVVATGLILLAVTYQVGKDRGFVAGRISYQTDVLDDVQRARRQAPNPDLLAGLQTPASLDDDAVPPSSARMAIGSGAGEPHDPPGPAWVRGLTYINVQGFEAGSGQDAERVRDFLAERGIETAIVPLRSGRRLLLTTQGFDRDTADGRRRCDEMLERVRSLGPVYQKAGGRYNWEDAFPRLLEKNSW